MQTFSELLLDKSDSKFVSYGKWVNDLRSQILIRCSQPEKSIFISIIPSENMYESADISLHLAKSFAKSGKSVLLIDADLKNPKICRLFRRDGLDKFICNSTLDMASKNIITHSSHKNLHFFGSDVSLNNWQDQIASDAFDSFMNDCRQSFDVVITQTTPSDSCSSYLHAARNSDIAILLAKQDLTKVIPLKKVIENLKLAKIKNPYWLFINGNF